MVQQPPDDSDRSVRLLVYLSLVVIVALPFSWILRTGYLEIGRREPAFAELAEVTLPFLLFLCSLWFYVAAGRSAERAADRKAFLFAVIGTGVSALARPLRETALGLPALAFGAGLVFLCIVMILLPRIRDIVRHR